MRSDFITFTKYPNFKEANLDASILREGGIDARVEALNPSLALYYEENAEIVIRIPAEDEIQALVVLTAAGIEFDRVGEDEAEEQEGDEDDYDDW